MTVQEWIDYLKGPRGWLPMSPDEAHQLGELLEATVDANEEMCKRLAELGGGKQ